MKTGVVVGAVQFNKHELRLDWVVAGKGEVVITADFQRGGVHINTIKLPAASMPVSAL